jgi:hypothetical protein
MLCLVGAFSHAQATTLTWKLASWTDGDWDFVTDNWNPGSTVFIDGADVIFNTSNSGVNLNTTVRPSSVVLNAAINNRDWLAGNGDLADYDGNNPTTVTINGVEIRTAIQNVPTFSGGLFINGGNLRLPADLNGFGTGDIVLDSGGRLTAGGTVTFNQTVRVLTGGGNIRPSAVQATYAGDVYLAGNLTLSGGDWERARITGDITLQNDVTITGGNTNTNSLAFTTLSGAASGNHTLTMDVNTNGRMTIDGDDWSIGGLVVTGAGQLWIDSEDIIGHGGGMTIVAGSGLVRLMQDQTLSFLTLGDTVFTEQGTFATTHFDPDNDWFTSTSTGMITIIPEHQTYALLFGTLIGAFILVIRRRKNLLHCLQ